MSVNLKKNKILVFNKAGRLKKIDIKFKGIISNVYHIIHT